LLPTLSRLSVSIGPESRLRHGCSSQYLRISPLHWEFHSPLPYSSVAVSNALPGLSPGLSQPTCYTAYAPFTPSNSEQRLHPPYYRGCWHGVSRCFLWWYHQFFRLLTECVFSHLTELYDPKAFFTHAALLRQGFPHCAKFLTAASRRSLARVSVPVWLIILSDQLPIIALVGRYPTNKLMGREPIPKRQLPWRGHLSSKGPQPSEQYPVLATLSRSYSGLRGRLPTRYSPVRHFTHIPKDAFSFDLHVLCTPPAFILSQDQTLQLYPGIIYDPSSFVTGTYTVSLFSFQRANHETECKTLERCCQVFLFNPSGRHLG
jgi:hypothetical protein